MYKIYSTHTYIQLLYCLRLLHILQKHENHLHDGLTAFTKKIEITEKTHLLTIKSKIIANSSRNTAQQGWNFLIF